MSIRIDLDEFQLSLLRLSALDLGMEFHFELADELQSSSVFFFTSYSELGIVIAVFLPAFVALFLISSLVLASFLIANLLESLWVSFLCLKLLFRHFCSSQAEIQNSTQKCNEISFSPY